MTSHRLRAVFVLLLTGAPLPAVLAQTAAPPSQPAAGQPAPAPSARSTPDDIVELSPFTITSDDDHGYQAQSSLGGGRIKTQLKDIAAPTSTFTAAFLQDTAITNTDDLAKYMLSTEYDYGEDTGGQNALGALDRPLRMRGLPGGNYTVDFFKADLRLDTFSLDRVDQSRGPNSVLFGIGNPGGIINATTKRAILSQEQGEVTVMGKSHNGLREELDFNQPLLNDKLAIRIAAVKDHEGSWRNFEFDHEQRYYGTVKYKLDSKTEINAEIEHGAIDKELKRTIVGYDAYTNWVAAGRQLGAAASAPAQIQALAGKNIPYLVYDSGNNTIQNWVSKTSSTLRTSADGEASPITDFSVVPRQTAFYGPGFDQNTNYNRMEASVDHAFTPDWNLQLAALRLDRHSQYFDAQGAPNEYLKVDTNATLPNGQVNPHAGQPYLEALTMINTQDQRDDEIRALMSYHRDLGWLGKHTLAALGEADYGGVTQWVTREQDTSPSAPNTTAADGAADNNNRVFRRTYVTLGDDSQNIVLANPEIHPINNLVDPATGIAYTTTYLPFNQNTQLTSYKESSAIGMLQSSFWKDRVDTVIGASSDDRIDFLGAQALVPQAGFAGGTVYPIRSHSGFRSYAKSFSFSAVLHVTDWLGLTYSKAENSALPSFTGRLRSADGTNPFARPPTPRGQSQDFGFKLDVWQHKIFLTADYFETRDARDFAFAPIIGTTVNPIWASLQLANVPVPSGYTYNTTTVATSVPTITDTATGATFDARSHGVEMELIANPSEHWRIFANYSRDLTTHTNIGPEELTYINLWRPFWIANGSVPISGGAAGATVATQTALVDAAVLANYTLADGKQPLGQMRNKVNLRTSYDLSGWARNFTIGGGMRYNSPPVIGYFATATPSGQIVANVDYGSAQAFYDADIAYKRKLSLGGKPVLWTLQLNINNVTDNEAFVRLRESSIGETELYLFNPPREWIISSKFSF